MTIYGRADYVFNLARVVQGLGKAGRGMRRNGREVIVAVSCDFQKEMDQSILRVGVMWYTNAIGQRAAGVVLPKNVHSSSRTVPPCFSSVEAVKGLSRRASVFHRGLNNTVCIVNNIIRPPY